MSQYPPFETCNLGYTHVKKGYENFPLSNCVFGPDGREEFLPPSWISIKDRFPEPLELVLLSIKTPVISSVTSGWNEALSDKEDPLIVISDPAYRDFQEYVTHWMILPEPHK